MSAPPDVNIPYYMGVNHAALINEQIVDPAANFGITTAGIELNKSLIQLVNEQVANNPYASVVAYDPTEALDGLGVAVEAFDDAITDADPEDDWTSFLETALAAYDDDIGGDSLTIDDLVEARYRRALKAMQIESARFVAGAADVNAVHSDAFVRSLGMMEGDLLASLKDHEFNLDFLDKQMKLDFLSKAVANMTNQQQARFGGLYNVAAITDDEKKTEIMAMGNYYREETDIVVNEAKWQLDNFGELGSFMGAINGAPRLSGIRQTPLQQFMTNALPAAAMMGSAGAMIGGPVGGVIGAIGGALGAGLYGLAGRQ